MFDHEPPKKYHDWAYQARVAGVISAVDEKDAVLSATAAARDDVRATLLVRCVESGCSLHSGQWTYATDFGDDEGLRVEPNLTVQRD
jgi:hypothetical protein